MVSTGLEELDRILGHGYPERSSVLLAGPPGVGKEGLAYSFASRADSSDGFSLYVTRLRSGEVEEDMAAFGNDASRINWISRDRGRNCDINDLAGLSFNIKEELKAYRGRKGRVVLDFCSSLLMLHPTEAVYRFFSQLLNDIKDFDVVTLATVDEGMHPPQVVAAMAQVFDGLLELKLYENGLRLVPLLRVVKMRGLQPLPNYYKLSFETGKMEILSDAR